MKSIIGKLHDTVTYSLNRGHVPVFYFNKTLNVGDVLNISLLESISNKKIFLTRYRSKSHILAIGSIMHFGRPGSHVWGSGIIDPNQVPSLSVLKDMRFNSVRGHLTKVELERRGVSIPDIPLGDPAVLLPSYYKPVESNKRYKLGIIPHFVDFESDLLNKYRECNDVVIIDVRQAPESFVDQISMCDHIISSSLHGLILSDAYNIPNAWVRFSDRIIGGNFKFNDYYSTTDRYSADNFTENEVLPLIIEDAAVLETVINNPESICVVNYYKYDLQRLIDAFPKIVA